LTPLRLGTRGSALALAQARAVAALLGEPSELVEITTAGDVDRSGGDKSRWTGALEAALVAGEIDLAVHSAKDVPSELAPGTAIVATPRRAEPHDALVGESSLDAVREGARVGTSALRRRAQLLAARPDLEVVDLRGNVDTRLRKREAGEVDVLVLAAAGLARLGRHAGARLPFVPAPGQGVIAVQGREGSPAADAARAADHPATRAELAEERAAVAALGASCRTPVGVFCDGARVHGFAGRPDGSEWLIDEAPSGAALAERMLAAGAAELLA
jgi:hydroxymethylbilane synthase